MYREKFDAAERAIAEVARQMNMSVGEVMAEMQEAIYHGYINPDPQIQAMWRTLPFKDRCPSPVELIAFVVDLASEAKKVQLRMTFPFLP